MKMREIMTIVESATTDGIPGDVLLRRYGKVYDWEQLPEPGKRAIERHYVHEHGASIRPDASFLYGVIPTDALIEALVQHHPEIVPDHGDFASYHAWYIRGPDVEDHGGSVWAVIMDQSEDYVLEDGWHRFHSYVRQGLEAIPAVGMRGPAFSWDH